MQSMYPVSLAFVEVLGIFTRGDSGTDKAALCSVLNTGKFLVEIQFFHLKNGFGILLDIQEIDSHC